MITWCIDSPGWGGAEMSAIKIMSLAKPLYGQRVILSRQADNRLVEALQELQIPFEYNSVPAALPNIFRGVARALRLIRKYRKSFFLVWCHHPDSNRWLQFCLSFSHCAFALAERSLPADKAQLAASRLTIPLKKRVIRRARAVILNASANAALYSELFGASGSRIRVIPNGVDVNRITAGVSTARKSKAEFAAAMGIPQGYTVLCTGRLAHEKNYAAVINAIRYLYQTGESPLNLVFVGADGGQSEQLKKQASGLPRIFFPGHTDNIIPWLALADCFVLPSIAEGMSRALLEAMAAGIPCIASDIPGNRSLLKHRENGLLFSLADEQGLAGCIKELIGNHSFAQRIGEQAYISVLNEFDIAAEKQNWQDFFTQFAKEAGRPDNL